MGFRSDFPELARQEFPTYEAAERAEARVRQEKITQDATKFNAQGLEAIGGFKKASGEESQLGSASEYAGPQGQFIPESNTRPDPKALEALSQISVPKELSGRPESRQQRDGIELARAQPDRFAEVQEFGPKPQTALLAEKGLDVGGKFGSLPAAQQLRTGLAAQEVPGIVGEDDQQAQITAMLGRFGVSEETQNKVLQEVAKVAGDRGEREKTQEFKKAEREEEQQFKAEQAAMDRAIDEATASTEKVKVTQAQAKLAMFAIRTQQAEEALSALEVEGFDPSTFRQAFVKPNITVGVRSPEERRYAQALRNFVNATLRQESGAAIAPSEFDSANRQYFAELGDDAKTLEQKRQSRLAVISGFEVGAGDALEPVKSKFLSKGGKLGGGKKTDDELIAELIGG